MTRRLMWHGTLLVLARLCIGLVIPYTATPRVTLGAHVCTIMNGLLVALAGILWPHLRLSPRGQIWTAGLLVSSGYVLSASLFLGGVTGAGSRRPLAGGGQTGSAWAAMLVTAGLPLSAPTVIEAVGLLLVGLRGRE